jgi:hypothetical protein
MWENDNDSAGNYEGLFAPKPDRVEHGLWGSKEVFEHPFSGNTEVTRDWYGQVTQVDEGYGYLNG